MTYTYNKIEQLVLFSENAVNETKKERVSRIISVMSVIPRGDVCRRLNTSIKSELSLKKSDLPHDQCTNAPFFQVVRLKPFQKNKYRAQKIMYCPYHN